MLINKPYKRIKKRVYGVTAAKTGLAVRAEVILATLLFAFLEFAFTA